MICGNKKNTSVAFSRKLWKTLKIMIDLGKYNPALPADHSFTGVQASYYWTSSTPANNDDQAWVVHFYLGFVTHDDKAGSHYVWYVR